MTQRDEVHFMADFAPGEQPPNSTPFIKLEVFFTEQETVLIERAAKLLQRPSAHLVVAAMRQFACDVILSYGSADAILCGHVVEFGLEVTDV